MNIYTYRISPYWLLFWVAIIAYFPVATWLFSLKNDTINLDLPFKFFISECLHEGEPPLWNPYWAMGFPLQSPMIWSIFSPIQFLFCSLFRYDNYILHIELIFYIILAGWGMYYYVSKHLTEDKAQAFAVATMYMLSGFTLSSGQFQSFAAANALLPWVFAALYSFLKQKEGRFIFFLLAVEYVLLTNAYPAYFIILTYVSLIIYIYNFRKEFIAKTFVFTICFLLFSATYLYGTLELIPQMVRGTEVGNPESLNSNYFHPYSLLNLILPSIANLSHFKNSDITMQTFYWGILLLLGLPTAILQKEKRFYFIAAFICLLLSFGTILGLRNALNFLPGMSLFRHAAIFRHFAGFFLLCGVVGYLPLLKYERKTIYTAFLLLISLLLFFGYNLINTSFLSRLAESPSSVLINFDPKDVLIINAIIQIFLLLAYLYLRKSNYIFIGVIFLNTLDLSLNSLINEPIMTLSSYSPKHVSHILQSKKGFPLPDSTLAVPSGYADDKGNYWANTNVYQKKISSELSYLGALVFKTTWNLMHNKESLKNTYQPFLYIKNALEKDTLSVWSFRPTEIKVQLVLSKPSQIIFQQNYFKGWHAFFGGKKITVQKNELGLMSINLPAEKGMLTLCYQKMYFFYIPIFIDIILIIFLLYFFMKK